MKGNNWAGLLIYLILISVAVIWPLNNAMGSECIKCHTDKNKLQSITKDLPKKEKSTETTGKG